LEYWSIGVLECWSIQEVVCDNLDAGRPANSTDFSRQDHEHHFGEFSAHGCCAPVGCSRRLNHNSGADALDFQQAPIDLVAQDFDIPPILHHSNTPPLHHSNTPSLQYSTTPILHHSNTPILQHSDTPAATMGAAEKGSFPPAQFFPDIRPS
jgi:hypothetical protein